MALLMLLHLSIIPNVRICVLLHVVLDMLLRYPAAAATAAPIAAAAVTATVAAAAAAATVAAATSTRVTLSHRPTTSCEITQSLLL
jgi:hypothetical protein